MTIDLIITTYKPDEGFVKVVDAIASQSVTLNRIIILNKEEKYFDRLLFNGRFLENHKNFEVHHVSAREYDLGHSRNQCIKYSEADYVLFMHQNAMPVGTEVLSGLLNAFMADPKVAVACARPVPPESKGPGEQYIFNHYYPDEPSVRSKEDLTVNGWHACISSNACALYSRKIFDELGGFENHVIRNEDMLFAAKALMEGYKVAYVPSSEVRIEKLPEPVDEQGDFFDMAVSFAMHPEIFPMKEILAEGRRVFKAAVNEAAKESRTRAVGFRRLLRKRSKGFNRGRIYRRLSPRLISANSYNKGFWRAEELMRARSTVDSHQGYGRSAQELDMLHGNKIKTHTWSPEEETKE